MSIVRRRSNSRFSNSLRAFAPRDSRVLTAGVAGFLIALDSRRLGTLGSIPRHLPSSSSSLPFSYSVEEEDALRNLPFFFPDFFFDFDFFLSFLLADFRRVFAAAVFAACCFWYLVSRSCTLFFVACSSNLSASPESIASTTSAKLLLTLLLRKRRK